jgi:hypothetical protein
MFNVLPGMRCGFDGKNEAVAASAHGLYELGLFGRIPQSLPHFVDGGGQAVVKIDEGIGRPQAQAQLFARDHFSRKLQEHSEQAKRLLLKSYLYTLLAQLPRPEVNLEVSKVDDISRRNCHGG